MSSRKINLFKPMQVTGYQHLLTIRDYFTLLFIQRLLRNKQMPDTLLYTRDVPIGPHFFEALQ